MVDKGFYLLILFVTVTFGQSGPYYGLPLGAFHYTTDDTTAEVYAADPKSLMIVNLSHKPQPGCTTLMAGPRRDDVKEESIAPNGKGILLPIRAEVTRVKRSGFQFQNFNPFFGWPADFDNLRVEQPARSSSFNSNSAAIQPNPFAGIELDLSGTQTQPKPTTRRPTTTRRVSSTTNRQSSTSRGRNRQQSATKSQNKNNLIVFNTKGEAINMPESAKAITRRPTTRRPVTRRPVSRRPVTRRPTTRRTTARRPTTTRRTTTRSPTTTRRTTTRSPTTTRRTTTPRPTTTTTQRQTRRRPTIRILSPLPRRTTTRRPIAVVTRRKITRTTTTQTTATTTKATTSAATTQQTRTTPEPKRVKPEIQQVLDPGPKHEYQGIQVVESLTGHFEAPSNVHPNFFGPLPRLHEINNVWPPQVQTTKSSAPAVPTRPTLSIDHDVFKEGGYTALFGVEPPPTTTPPSQFNRGGPGAAPPGAEPPGSEGLVFVLGGGSRDVDSNTIDDSFGVPTEQIPRGPTAPTKSWYVIEDPRAERRRLRPRPTLPPEFYQPEVTTPSLPPPRYGEQFILPEMSGRTLQVYYPDNAVVTDFEWFGIYDHCLGRRTAYVSTKDITPPQEVLIEGIKGWQYGVNSGPIHIMNCNTLLLEKFNYTGYNFSDSFFFVGIGDFPDFVVQQDRAYVVGRLPDQPLRDYNEEDVMIRLPRGWKTFDINFLSVYNPTHRASYGSINIPPLIVPPCEDLAQL